jgi:hypothetical protein
MHGGELQGIGTGRTRRVAVQVILEDFTISIVEPRTEERRLPEPGGVVRGIRASEVLHGSHLRLQVG